MVAYVLCGAWLVCGVAALVVFLANGGRPGGGEQAPWAIDNGPGAGLGVLALVASGPLGLVVILGTLRAGKKAEAEWEAARETEWADHEAKLLARLEHMGLHRER